MEQGSAVGYLLLLASCFSLNPACDCPPVDWDSKDDVEWEGDSHAHGKVFRRVRLW